MAFENSFYEFRQGKMHFFCPLCKYHQSTNTIEKISWKHHVQLALATSALAYLCWPLFEEKGFCIYFALWLGFEFFYRIRKRAALVCESCGFDPFLFKRDVVKARAELKKHWQDKIDKENLFPGIKLKNYRTSSVKQDAPSTGAPPNAVNDALSLGKGKENRNPGGIEQPSS